MILTTAVGFIWVIYHSKTGHYPINDGFTETYAAIVVAFISTVVFSLLLKDEKKVNP